MASANAIADTLRQVLRGMLAPEVFSLIERDRKLALCLTRTAACDFKSLGYCRAGSGKIDNFVEKIF